MARRRTARAAPRSLLDRLAGRELLVVSGKGGTGKSVVAAALATLLAAHGRDTILLEADPRESLFHFLGVEPSGGEVVRVASRLRLQSVPLDRVVDGLVREILPVDWVARRVLESPVYRQFAAGAPGLRESCLLGHALNLLEHPALALGRGGRAPDVVVLDAPASGHAVFLLDAPRLLSEVIERGPVGALVSRLGRFLSEPARCGVLVTTLAEEMPVEETLELLAALERSRRAPPEALVLNALWPEASRARRARDPREALRRGRAEASARERKRLLASWTGPVAEVPLVPMDGGRALVDAVAASLASAFEPERAAS